jgi:16S rRNA A1518/A1519 N6-dimethyltransferase RsmA/KsgA/DIM1 with predicted DNA glycosylase/AP lyase activity
VAGQTITELRGLLSAKGLAPRKRFGQNFLIDLNLMRKLVAAAKVEPGDMVLEVGPGTGSLTELLLDAGAAVVAVEIDRGLAEIIGERLGDHPRFMLIHGDALATKHELNPQLVAALRLGGHRGPPPSAAGRYVGPPHSAAGGHRGRPHSASGGHEGQPHSASGGHGGQPHSVSDGQGRPPHSTPHSAEATAAGPKLVANLPYQIATPLLMELLRFEPRFALFAFTIQKEVAERLMAFAGDEAYGPISVVAQSLATLERIATLGPGAFWPRPQVESAMVLMRPLTPSEVDIENVGGFVELVRGAFQHRRQMLRKIVSRWPNREAAITALSACGIDPCRRPQDLPPSEWRRFHARLAGSPL